MDRDPTSHSQHAPDGMELAVKPWRHNPSSWRGRLFVTAWAAVAGGIALYMGLYQLKVISNVWDPVFGNQTKEVLDSEVSRTFIKWARIPDAILGALAYLGDIVFALAGSTRRWQDRPWLVILFGINVIPLGIVSTILVFLQGAVIGAWCFLCLVTAMISLILIFFAYGEILSSLLFLWHVWKSSHDPRILWDTFWGKPTEISWEAGKQLTKIHHVAQAR